MGTYVRLFTNALVWAAGAKVGCTIGRKVAHVVGLSAPQPGPPASTAVRGASDDTAPAP